MAWLTNWTYRKAIVIAHTPDGAQTNYQLKLLVGESAGASGEEVDCNSHVASDFDDLRFTTSNGTTLCDYWIESITGTTPNQLATIWIEIPAIAAHPDDTTIYMYYGGTQTAVSSGANTFPFFDDFPGDAVDEAKWTPATASGGTIAVANSIATMASTSGAGSLASITSLTLSGTQSRVRYKFKTYNQTGGYGAYVVMGSDYAYNGFWGYYDTCRSSVAGTDQNPSTTSIYGGVSHIGEALRDGTNSKVYLDGVLEQGTARVGVTTKAGWFQAGRGDIPLAAKLEIYWYFQSNYTATEPTWGSFGSEEAFILKALSGTLNLSGAVGRKYRQFKSLAGTLNATGAVAGIMKSWHSLGGTLNLSGTVSGICKAFKSITGTLNTTGSLITRRAAVVLTGTLNFSGSLSNVKGIFKSLAGTLNMSGAVSRKWKAFKSLAGSLSFTGLLSTLKKIIGAGSVSVDSYLEINTFHLSKFTAEFTGIVSKIKVYSSASCNVKVAVYSDIGGEPSNLLSAVNTSTAVVAGWNTITIPSVSVGQGTAYWLAFNSG